MITKQTCSVLRGLLILALYRKQVSLINRWIKENKRRMAVFSFILTCAFSKTLRLQILSNYMAYPINSLIDELISLRPRSVFFSLFFTDSRGFTFHDQISSELRIETKQILISPRMGCIKAVNFGATNSWELKFQRRGQNEDIRYFGSVWLCTRCRLFSRTNWKWVGRDSRWIWSRKTSRVGCITKITGNNNCSYKMDWNKDATSTEVDYALDLLEILKCCSGNGFIICSSYFSEYDRKENDGRVWWRGSRGQWSGNPQKVRWGR